MKSVRTRPLAVALLSLAMTAGVIGSAVGPARAAYNPSSPPYPVDPNNATSLAIFDVSTGTVVDHGSSSTPLSSYYFVAKDNVNQSGTKASLSGYLAEANKAPGSWSGELLGAATSYPVAGHSTPTALGGSTDTFDALAGSYPNTAPSSSDFFQLYQLRVKTTFPAPQSTSYAFGDIQIDPAAHTWRVAGSGATAPPVQTAPGAPTGVSAVAHNGSATVFFTAPASNGGSDITSYKVTASTGETTSSTGSPVTLSGLSNGTSRTFTVQAVNSVGSGPASGASNPVVFFTTRVTAAVTSVINSGGSFALRGQLSGGSVASRRVVATITTAGHGSRTLALTTGSTGAYSTSVPATYNTSVVVRYAGSATQTSATSSLVRTAVRTVVRITSPKTGTRTTVRKVTITGTTSPNKAGQYVTVYERKSTGYVKLVSVKVASNGTYRYVRTFTKATHVLQVRIAAVTYNSAGTSNTVTLYEV